MRECEENLSTKQTETQKDSRVQGSDEHSGRKGHHQAQTRQGSQASHGLDQDESGVNRSSGRLSRSEDFTRVYRTGRSVANRYLVLYYFERPSSGPGTPLRAAGVRVGFSVSKRLGSAVDRNRIKRVLREAFQAHRHSLGGDMDLVLIARTPIIELLDAGGFKAVEDKMVEVLRKAALVSSREERRPSS